MYSRPEISTSLPADVVVAGADRLDHRVEGQLIGHQLVGVDRHLVLTNLATHRRDL
jgi:hypothetical protein